MDDSMISYLASTTSNNGEVEDVMEDARQGPDSRFPPGFHFHPQDHELILYYLRRKIANVPLLYDVFNDVKLYEYHPEQLVGKYAVWGENRWYFFTPRDRKYPNGNRPNRKTDDGYWKATGVDKSILCNGEQIGVRKALVFYRGKAGKGEKTDWIMYEYINQDPYGLPHKPDGTMKLDDWVLCTIQKKRGADEAKSDRTKDKRDRSSEVEQAGTNQSTKKPKISHPQRIQQDGREVDPLNHQIVHQIQQDGRQPQCYPVFQQNQQEGREAEPPLTYEVIQQIQQDGEAEPPLDYQGFQQIQISEPLLDYQVFQQIQQDGGEVEPPLDYQVFQQIQPDGGEEEPPLDYQVFQQIQLSEPPLDYQVFQQIQQDGGEAEPPLDYQVFQQIQQDGGEAEPPLDDQVFQQIQQDGGEAEPPLDYQVFQQIQQDSGEAEPLLDYQIFQQIQQDGGEAEPLLNHQVFQQIQQDGREVEPLCQVIHRMGCYDNNANYNNYSVTQAPAILSNDFMGFTGPTDIVGYSPGDQNFQQNFPNPHAESNGLGCQLDQTLDLEFENQQMVCGPPYSSPAVMPVNEFQGQDDTLEAELYSFLYGQEMGIGLDDEGDIAQVFPSQDGIVCQPSQDNHSNVNLKNNSDYSKDGEGFKFK